MGVDIPTLKNQGRLPVGGTKARAPGYMTAGSPAGAQAQFFGALGNLAAGVMGTELKADYDAEMTRGKADRAMLINQLNETLRTETNPEAYQQHLKNTIEQVGQIKLTNNKAQRDFQSEIMELTPIWQSNVSGKADGRRRLNVGASADYAADKITKLDPRDEMEYAEMQELMVGSAKALIEIGIPSEQVEMWTQQRLEDIEKRGVLLKALDAVEGGRLDLARNIVNNSGLEAEDKNRIMTMANVTAARYAQNLEIQRESNRDEISKLIRSGQSAASAIENSSLDEKEQWTWFERERAESERLVKGEDILTNQLVKGDIESMAYGIHDGSVTMPEFLKRLNEERYDKKNIDDSAYDSLKTIAEGKYESYQAREMAARIAHAKTQLVTYGDELSLVAAIQKMAKAESEQTMSDRQLQLDNLDKYRKVLNDWFEIQREQKKYPTADEIYKEGRKLLVHYRKTPEQLREEEANRTVDEEARNKLRQATRSHGQEELEKAKQAMSEKYGNQLDYLAITFKLNDAEKQKAKELLDSGASLDDLVKHLQGKK